MGTCWCYHWDILCLLCVNVLDETSPVYQHSHGNRYDGWQAGSRRASFCVHGWSTGRSVHLRWGSTSNVGGLIQMGLLSQWICTHSHMRTSKERPLRILNVLQTKKWVLKTLKMHLDEMPVKDPNMALSHQQGFDVLTTFCWPNGFICPSTNKSP